VVAVTRVGTKASAACSTSIRYTERLAEAEAVASVGSKGDSLLTG
jgi:hypothetical protein